MNTEKRLFTNSELEEIRKMRLIAAAPEMLEALQFVRRWDDMHPEENRLPSQLRQAIRAVIAKAKGVSHE